MEPDFLPEKLMKTSASLVRMTHKMHGLQRLPPRVALGNSLAALGCMSDTLAVLQTVVASFKYRIRAWVVAALCITLSFALSWWILIGAAVGAFVALRFAKEERDGWMYLAAVLLGMDVLAVNFGG